jgi:arylsulfatase A-like enzyme
VVPEALKFLESSPKKPFFLSCGFGDTHRVFQPRTLAEDPRWCRPPAPLPDAPETRQDMARFTASARVLDQAMGTVFAALEENGLADDTLVICTTDHGIAFPRMKCHLNDHGTGVMLIMRGPGGFRGGVVNDALVSHVDLFPTLCDLLGIEPPAWLQGTSLVPLVTGAAAEVNEAVFSENNYHASYEPMRTVRTKRWRYIRRFHSREVPFLANCDAGPTKTLLLENGWQDRGLAEEELYDLVFDPNEACNVAGDASAREALEEMRGRLDRWMKETDDPLLKGDIPLPEGAVVNRPDDRHPFDVWQYTDRPDHLA